MEVSYVQTVFCDILSETVQFYLYQVHVRTVLAITPCSVRTEHWNILKCWTTYGCVAMSSGRLAETSQSVSTFEIHLRVEQ
jgi:hypothetical protein